MGFHPCCGGSLQSGAKLVAIVQIIFATISLFGCGLVFVGVLAIGATIASENGKHAIPANVTNVTAISNFTSTENPHPRPDPAVPVLIGLTFILAIVIAIFGAFRLGLGILLLKGANQRHAWKCRVWLIIESICVAVSIGTFVGSLCANGVGMGSHVWSLLSLSFDFYCVWVVYSFIIEIEYAKAGGNSNSFGGGWVHHRREKV